MPRRVDAPQRHRDRRGILRLPARWSDSGSGQLQADLGRGRVHPLGREGRRHRARHRVDAGRGPGRDGSTHGQMEDRGRCREPGTRLLRAIPRRRPTRAARRPPERGRHRLPDLYLGNDRAAKGGDDHPPESLREYGQLGARSRGPARGRLALRTAPVSHRRHQRPTAFHLPRRHDRPQPHRQLRSAADDRVVERHRVTRCVFVPTQWQDICRRPEATDLASVGLRTALWGGSAAPRETLELMERTFVGVDIVSAFGQTEMSGTTAMLKGDDSLRKLGSVGKPVIGVDIRIVDEAGSDVAVGEVGELVYRGPMAMAGYHENRAATEEAFAGGWLHSGDLLHEDEEGFLYVVDRKKDMIISGGENIYPAEVERALLAHPAV